MTDYALPKLNFGINLLLVAAGLMALMIRVPSSLERRGLDAAVCGRVDNLIAHGCPMAMPRSGIGRPVIE